MDVSHRDEWRRAQFYATARGSAIVARLGFGLDGVVWQTDRQSAIKVFERAAAYQIERDVYQRLLQCQVTEINGHAVPVMIGHDDELHVIEMSLVQPPYLLDFAKAQLDRSPELDFPREVMVERHEHWAELFDERWPAVLAIMDELERRCGIHLLDVNPSNITFADS